MDNCFESQDIDIECIQSANNAPKRSKLKWTEEMDDTLIEVLSEEVLRGVKKPQNGWKNESKQKVVDMLFDKFKLVIKVENVSNRLKGMRKEFLAYDHASNASGFSFNHDTGLLEADDMSWKDYLVVHKDAEYLRVRKCRYLEALYVIIGNDQATGKGAKGGEEQPLKDVIDLDDNPDLVIEDEPIPPIESTGGNNASMKGKFPYHVPKNPAARAKRKRLSSDGSKLDDAIVALAAAATTVAQSFQAFTPPPPPPNTMELNAILRNVPGLSDDDRFRSLQKFADKLPSVEFFLAVDEDDRLGWIRRFLTTN